MRRIRRSSESSMLLEFDPINANTRRGKSPGAQNMKAPSMFTSNSIHSSAQCLGTCGPTAALLPPEQTQQPHDLVGQPHAPPVVSDGGKQRDQQAAADDQ